MIVGIDASNLSQGGGITHLLEILNCLEPQRHGYKKIIVWSRNETLLKLPEFPWLEKIHTKLLEGNVLKRSYWQKFCLTKEARKNRCDVLFVPGGSYAGDFRPVVVMSRNLLPFESKEIFRDGFTLRTLQLLLLRNVQKRSFQRADGVIFLSKYAKSIVERVTTPVKTATIIPHGLSSRFEIEPRDQRKIESYTKENPFRILYVSGIQWHKHQWHVVSAVEMVRKKTGWDIELDLVGPSLPGPLRRLQDSIKVHDSSNKWARYIGEIEYKELHTVYRNADLAVYASSCENMPNTLLEHMASGLPIACSNRGPMPEVLKDAGRYFDPEEPQDIAKVIELLIASPSEREIISRMSFELTKNYNWQQCADNTFKFLKNVAEATPLIHV